MKVGLLTTSFPRYEGDIAGHFVLGFARALARRGHEVCVLAPEPDAPLPPPHFEGLQLRWLGYLRPRSLQRTFYGDGVPDNLRRDPRTALGLLPFTAQLAREARSRAPEWDALVSHWAVPCGLVASLVPQRPRHLAVLHSADVHALQTLPAGRLMAARVARGSDHLLFVSRDLRRRFLGLLDERERVRAEARAHVSPMGIEPGPAPLGRRFRKELRAHLKLPPGPVLLSMGRLVPIKGVERLVEAARARPEVALVIAGDGGERAALERRAEGLPNVRFVGHVSGEHKRCWLQAADAFALPSRTLPGGRSEGAPTALLEALDAGLPVLASASGGIPEVLRDGVEGWLVDEVPGAWEAAFDRLLEPGSLRPLAQRARRRARQFHWDALMPHIEALLM